MHIVIFDKMYQPYATIEFSVDENGTLQERPFHGVIPVDVKEEIRRKFEMGIYEGEMGEFNWSPAS